jgi:hypothetical protein
MMIEYFDWDQEKKILYFSGTGMLTSPVGYGIAGETLRSVGRIATDNATQILTW